MSLTHFQDRIESFNGSRTEYNLNILIKEQNLFGNVTISCELNKTDP